MALFMLLLLTRIMDETKQSLLLLSGQCSILCQVFSLYYQYCVHAGHKARPVGHASLINAGFQKFCTLIKRQIQEELFIIRMKSHSPQCWLIQVMIRQDDVPVVSR